MDDDIQQLIGRQIAEFNRAARFFQFKFLVQLLTAALAVTTVLIIDPPLSYWLSLVSLALGALWAYLEIKYRSIRACAERARRATLIMGGLGKKISSHELNDIRECLSSSEAAGKKLENPDYFESNAPAGSVRLAEMLEESAYWTLHIQRISARIMWGLFVVVIIAALASLFVLIPDTPNEQLMTAARVVCAALTFAVGTDLFGAARAYSDTVHTLDRIMHRFDSAKARKYPEADLLLILADYNAAVENTPLSLPFIYDLKKEELERNWKRRQTDNRTK